MPDRHSDDDTEALNSFDVGDTSIPWFAEVAEIVAGLLGWRSDPAAADEDRQVVIAERDGELVAVAAHVRLVGADGRSMSAHRYLTWPLGTERQSRARVGRPELFDSWRGLVGTSADVAEATAWG